MYKEFTWDRYLKYDELTEFLKAVETDHPDLCSMYSIGKTYEGRDIWCVELTNKATGAALDKPAIWADGNTHAGEVTGCMTALYTIKHLVSNYGEDPRITKMLDESTFYIVPRLSADGAELFLTEPYTPRSSIRPWPFEEEQDGLYPADVDGDGIIAQMRIEDENGEYRVSEKDPRVMVRRKPNEIGGKYYSILGEGLIRNFNGVEVKPAPDFWGLDVNRNYGSNWRQHHIQSGAGPYPFSEAESRAVAEFFQSHENIGIAQSYHTFSGVILRPPASRPDAEIHLKDFKAFKVLGDIGTELTGYKCIGVYEDFQFGRHTLKKAQQWGTAMEWWYDHNGVLVFATELWDLPNRAIGRWDTFKTLLDWTEDEQIKMQEWNDEHLNGEGFINWRPFDHPQLGKVEIGGWKHRFVIQNPPAPFLEQECHKNTLFFLELALTLPKLRIVETSVKSDSPGVYVVSAVVRNMGYLPSNVTQQAIVNNKAGKVKVKIELDEGGQLLGSEKELTLPHIEGRHDISAAFSSGRLHKHLCQWVVRAPEGSSAKIRVHAPKAGAHEVEVKLG